MLILPDQTNPSSQQQTKRSYLLSPCPARRCPIQSHLLCRHDGSCLGSHLESATQLPSNWKRADVPGPVFVFSCLSHLPWRASDEHDKPSQTNAQTLQPPPRL